MTPTNHSPLPRRIAVGAAAALAAASLGLAGCDRAAQTANHGFPQQPTSTTDETGLQQSDFVQTTSHDTERLLSRLREILLGIDHSDLRGLVTCFLDDPNITEPLSQAPAGIRLHHAYHGGLLEHIVNLLETIVRIADLYPKVDSRLLLVGAFLHDIGKVRELTWDPTFGYSDEGQLIGHLAIGIEMFDDKAREFAERFGHDFPEELSLRIKHMILSHHGTYEHGSARLPMTPEAIGTRDSHKAATPTSTTSKRTSSHRRDMRRRCCATSPAVTMPLLDPRTKRTSRG